jgi:hypothetical protein
MASMEPSGFCTLNEYDQNKKKRIRDGSELQPDDLYTLMLRLGSDAYAAARKTVKLSETKRQHGLFVIKMAFVNPNLKVEARTVTTISDGYVNEFNGVVLMGHKKVDGSQDRLPIIEGYLKDYWDEFYDFMRESDERLIVSA